MGSFHEVLSDNLVFFSFFTYTSINFWVNHSHHQNLHKIPRLFIYNMSGVDEFAKKIDLILMCAVVILDNVQV